MKRQMLIIGLFIALFSSAPAAQATLMSVDDSKFGAGSFTLDTATGLEWLDLSQTFDKSMDSIKADSGVGETYDGLRYATNDEVVALYSDAGLNVVTRYNATTVSNFASTNLAGFFAAYDLLTLIGYAPAPYSRVGGTKLRDGTIDLGELIVFGITGTGPSDPFGHYISSNLYARNPGGIEPYGFGYTAISPEGDGGGYTSASHDILTGSFLVKEQPAPVATPEPSTLLLLGMGLAGVVIYRKSGKRAC